MSDAGSEAPSAKELDVFFGTGHLLRFLMGTLSLFASTKQELLNSAHLQPVHSHDPDPDIAGSYRCHRAGRTQRRAPAIRDRDALP